MQHPGAGSRRHNGAASPERLLGVDPVTPAISRGRLDTCEWRASHGATVAVGIARRSLGPKRVGSPSFVTDRLPLCPLW